MLVEEGGGGENGLESWAEFEVTTDPNGSEPSSEPEPKSEAASCTVLISSYARRVPRGAVGARSKTKQKVWSKSRTVGGALNGESCSLQAALCLARRSGREIVVGEQWRKDVIEAMSG